jgi:hypothetical protein
MYLDCFVVTLLAMTKKGRFGLLFIRLAVAIMEGRLA